MKELTNPNLLHEADFTHRIHTEVEPWCATNLHRGRITSFDGKLLRYYYAMNKEATGTIMVMHGLSEFIGKYRELLYTFYHAGYNVFFYEQRGHGDSAREIKNTEYIHVKSFDKYMEDLKWFMDKKVLPTVEMHKTPAEMESHPIFLFGHSMGGAVSAAFLETYPEYFDAAVLASPMIGMKTGSFTPFQIKLFADAGRLLHFDKRPAAGQGGFDPDEPFETSCSLSPARFAYILEQRRAHPRYQTGGPTISWVGAAMRACEKIRAEAGKVDIPVLILQAGADELVDNDAQEAFASASGDTRIISIPGAKHELMNGTDEITDRFYGEIFRFYGEQAEKLNG